jgi:hypothetical protein
MDLRHRMRRAGAAACIVFAIAAGEAPAQSLAYTGSVQFGTGDYIFAERTNSVYVVNGLDLQAGRARFSATLPVIAQSTPWVSYGLVPIPSGGAHGGEVAQQTGQGRRRGGGTPVLLPVTEEGTEYELGVGDPLVRGEVELLRDRGAAPALRVAVSAKVPVTDPDDGFGSGEWDTGGGLSLSKRFGSSTLFADGGYWRFGDLPELPLKDAFAYSVGYGYVFAGARWGLLANVSGWTTILDGTDAPLQVGVGVNRVLSIGRSIGVSATVGLTETAPDLTVALGWRMGL